MSPEDPLVRGHWLCDAPLKNRYFAMRHGHSQANAQSIIVSDPGLGVEFYGLSDLGLEQLNSALGKLPDAFDARLKIVSSDFLRARESAAILAESLKTEEPVSYSKHLRERFFGELEGQPDGRYGEVWQCDALDPGHREFGVEPASDVVSRVARLVEELESLWTASVILLVAHGDVLQLLQCAFENRSPMYHRQLPPLKVGEIRELRKLS